MSRARGVFDRLERTLPSLAEAHPRLAFGAAGALGSLRNRLSRRWPSPEQVQTLFPHLGHRAAARVAWEIGGNEARNRLLVERLRHAGLAPFRPLVRTPPALLALRPPLVLGMVHTGAIQALGAAIERLPGPVLLLRHGLLHTPASPVEIESTAGDGQRRALSFHRALLHLQRGGFVVVALDVEHGASLETRCLGRPLQMARGPFALARITGAPLRPIAARWEGDGIGTVLGEELARELPDSLDATARENALAAAAAAWLARYLLSDPAEVGLGLLRTLLASSGALSLATPAGAS